MDKIEFSQDGISEIVITCNEKLAGTIKHSDNIFYLSLFYNLESLTAKVKNYDKAVKLAIKFLKRYD